MTEINNLTTVKIDEKFLRKVAKTVLEGEEKESDLSIAIIGSGRMRELNKKYRGKNKVTDVLAFGQNQKSKIPEAEQVRYGAGKNKKFPIIPESKMGLGEIAICLREVKKNAKRFNSVFEQELARVLIHGILHLLGYDHEKNEKAAKEMEEKQKYYLNKTIKI